MKNNMENKKFFLYARKSTDVEDKQVLSIDAQLTELREYAARENIEISAEIVEKQSAKVPCRPLFNKMMKEIETFGGNILAWNPDRRIPAIRWTEDRLFISLTQGNLRASSSQLSGVITLVRVNLCSIWLSVKANTI